MIFKESIKKIFCSPRYLLVIILFTILINFIMTTWRTIEWTRITTGTSIKIDKKTEVYIRVTDMLYGINFSDTPFGGSFNDKVCKSYEIKIINLKNNNQLPLNNSIISFNQGTNIKIIIEPKKDIKEKYFNFCPAF